MLKIGFSMITKVKEGEGLYTLPHLYFCKNKKKGDKFYGTGTNG